MNLAVGILKVAGRILTLILCILTIAAAYGGRVNPHLWGFPSVLTLLFPWLWLLTLVVGIVWVFCRKFLTFALVGIFLVGSLGAGNSPFPLGSEAKAEEGKPTFTLLTYNIYQGIDIRKPNYGGNRALEFILASKADIVCIQELPEFNSKRVPNFKPSLRDSLAKAYPVRLIDKTNDLTLLSKYPAQLLRYDGEGDLDTHLYFDIYKLKVLGHELHICNVHLPSYHLTANERTLVTDIHGVKSAESSLKEFKGSILAKLKESFRMRADIAAKLRDRLQSIPGAIIVCGDFNDVPGSWTYRKILGDDFTDAFRATNFYSKETYNDHLFLFHIDQVLCRGPLKPLSVKVERIDASDHYPLLCRFQFTEPNNID